ncbi:MULTISPECIES: hypothetical protein [Halobacillus]|nr:MULTISPECIES: hypothetical protein [Halobacillus]MCA1020862.1 hypothetical protein [Halobacillus litoralis]
MKGKGERMRPPYENYQRALLGTLLLAVVLAVLALFQLEHQWLVLLLFYVLTAGFVLEGLVAMKKQLQIDMIIQLLRAFIIFVFATILYF